MRLLALDTATEGCSAAVLEGAGIITRYEELERGHAERILAMVDEVLVEAGVSLRQLDAIAFGRGPGGFTGVRLAVSIAQGLAFGAGLGVVPISDLRAMAQRALAGASGLRGVLVCNDARMQEVYWSYCRRDPQGMAEAGALEQVGPPQTVELPAEAEKPIRGVGRGFRAHPQIAQRLQGALECVDAAVLPHAEDIARLAVAELELGRVLSPEEALPVYLRDDVVRPPSRA